tara:strand:+ start:268 stop:459 length:192 start_codon:yes stop_codon:yes gene_type:complete
MQKIPLIFSSNHNSPGNQPENKSPRAFKEHFKINDNKFLVLTWIKGLWTGILISLIIHQLFSH